STGLGVVAAAGVAFLGLFLWLYTRPRTQRMILHFEQGGWFHATSYKGNQGVRVRRGTIFGILLMVGAGIYTLISHGALKRGSPDLELAIPFTGAVAVETYGDTYDWIAALPDSQKDRVQIRYPGATDLQPKQTIPTAEVRRRVKEVLDEPGWESSQASPGAPRRP